MGPVNLVGRLLISLIKGYQYWSAYYGRPCCRFHPTCSTYAIDSIRYHGVFFGCCLAIRRILRCQPLCKGGFDPVPTSSTFSFLRGSSR